MKKNNPSSLPFSLPLGGMTPETFLKDYWQKKPLLIRAAFPNFEPLLDAPALFQLAQSDEVESRLINSHRQHWSLKNGPFAELPLDQKKAWTLLVQGVNLHDRAADALLRRFNFIPNARLDDLMISYARDGGGVGPHFDSYDVFLLQAHGKRRWQISAQKDLSLIEGMPLKILRNFKAEETFELEAGDMLYLPPHYAHDGIAIGECMTYSIGFRSPSYQELGEAFLQFMSDTIDLPDRYSDPELAMSKRPAEIGAAMIEKIAEQIAKIKFTKNDIQIFLGEYLSEPKSSVFFQSPEKPLTPKKFAASAQKSGLSLMLKTQMLYQGNHIFVNGESFSTNKVDGAILKKLADQRALLATDLSACSPDVWEAFCIWYEDGWIKLGND
jgi:50S ribosomal protein L16 3-hydroxylase